MKILLGGVPFGCDNIGDEAILGCVVKLFRSRMPGIELTVATRDATTGERLGVAITSCWGFDGKPLDGFDLVVREYDAYVWCGATGLSDYPYVALDLLEHAQRQSVPTFVWGVGMDDELNPAFFKASGRRRKLLSLVGACGFYERLLRMRVHLRMRKVLSKCRGVWLRDPQSAARLLSSGFTAAKIAADTAILQESTGSAQFARMDGIKTLGLCISAQRNVGDERGLLSFLSTVLARKDFRIVAIPMNPKTDRELMGRLHLKLGRPDGFLMFEGDDPGLVVAQAGECDLVLSSRLHLLILAANAGTPIRGIARGSKLANWLANFNIAVSGSVDSCDWGSLARNVIKDLDDDNLRRSFEKVRATAYANLHARMNDAADEMFGILNGGADER